MRELDELFAALGRSRFRSSFGLNAHDQAYLHAKGLPVIGDHPVFVAQHATACCCRSCLQKWHQIPAGRALSADEQTYVVNVLMHWLEKAY